MNWDAWARHFEAVEGADAFEALFAPQRTFEDPVTAPTADVRAVVALTDSVFPDWRQEIHSIRGGDGWAFFEWTGTATYGATDDAEGAPIVMHGATVVEVDEHGLVTRWRDYLDTNEPLGQIQAAAAD